jgi:hypothetical protein
MRLIIASGPNNFNFAVLDFTTPATPTVSHTTPVFGGSCTLDTNDELAAVGNMNGGQVELYDLSDPSAPARLGSVATGLFGIAGLSFDGTRVLAGEMNGLRAALIDVADPSAPKLVSLMTTGISSIASIVLAGTRAIAAGPNDDTIDILNYANPAAPTRAGFFPNLNGPLVADLDGTRAAVGDQGGASVALVDIATRTVLGVANTTLASISSISIDGNRVVASSTNEVEVAIIDFSTPGSPTVRLFNPGTGGGRTIVQSGGLMATGAVLGNTVGLVNLGGATPTVIATANSAISSISSLALTEFVPVAAPGKIATSSTKLAFGDVAVCLNKKQTVVVKNVGKGKLALTSISATGPYAVAPSAPTTLVPNGGLLLTVTFTPAVVGTAPGTLSITSDDPSTPTLVVPLEGTALPTPPPEIEVRPASLYFGASLPKYFFGKRVVVDNKSPCLPLTVQVIGTGNAVFPLTDDPAPTRVPTTFGVSNVVIPPLGSRTFVVVFAPPAVGDYNGTLIVRSNDPKRPTVFVPLSGSAVLAKPTAVSMVLDQGMFMSFSVAGVDRMELLKTAVRLFVELMPEEQGDFLGSVLFGFNARRFTAMLPSNAAAKTALLGRMHDLVAGAGNNLEDGLLLGLAQLEVDLPKLAPAVPPERLVLLVFTAGAELRPRPDNAPHALEEQVLPEVLAAGAEVYAIAMGLGIYASPERLSHLAASSKGKFFAADDALLLRKNFVQVLADAFRMNMAADPTGTISRGQTRDIPMHVTKCERRLKFVCIWEELQEQLTLELIAPDGTRFTSVTPATNPLVRYAAQPGSAFFDVMLPPLDDDDDVIGPQVVGVWHLHVIAGQQAGSTRFTAALLVESPVKFRTHFSAFAVLEPSRIHFDLLHGDHPIPGAEIAVTLLAPRESGQAIRVRELALARRRAKDDPSGDSLAVSDLREDDVLHSAADSDARPTHDAVAVRTPRELTLPRIAVEQTDLVAGATRDFRYSVDLRPQKTDGIYQLIVEVRAPACGGTVTRYVHYAFAPRQRFDPRLSDYAISRIPKRGEPVELLFTPRDRAGNLIGPSKRDSIKAAVNRDAVVVGIIDRFDGSYLVRIALARPTAMTLSLRVGDVEHTFKLPRYFYWMRFTQPFRRWLAAATARWRVWLALRQPNG